MSDVAGASILKFHYFAIFASLAVFDTMLEPWGGGICKTPCRFFNFLAKKSAVCFGGGLKPPTPDKAITGHRHKVKE